jgi:hypothetical protein
MAKYRKKPIEVEAMQFTKKTKDQVYNFVRGNCFVNYEGDNPILVVQTIHGEDATVRLGDWVVKEPSVGHYYPVKPDIFKMTYEAA